MTPEILGVNSCTHQDLVVADSRLRSRLELLNIGADGTDYLPYYCIYMADQPTWLEPDSGGIQHIPAYDIAIINSEVALRTVSTIGTRHLSLFLPRALMLGRMAWADDLCGRSIRLDVNTRATAHSLMHSLRASIQLQHFDTVGPYVVQALLELLITLGHDVTPPRANLVISTRQEQVSDCIKRHFSDPGLTVAAIAGELRVSARYLQRVCEGGESPGEQLRQFRLRKAAERLRSSVWKDRSISEVCFSCGFSSSSHFSTEFRRFFGVTPREYRS